ncbi:hypothetical protein F2Q69_00005610 [Brassica cretica]|uniref:Small ribosomal subunit protein mS38 n=1 Tax=Brassica cretica TaxID=69181 RepID=A0A8S9P3M6_BRACR|nr:hypothetical protein F2Q69_00005610 [Brassica cretica]
MHRFLRNQSCLRAIPRLTPSLIPHQKPCIVESVSEESDPVSVANPVITVSAFKPDESLRFYPSFPIGYGFNTTMVHGSGLIDMVPFTEAVVEDEVVIYADSVKKKRKKKMNKHKYRKLRKTQGRKS